MHGQNEQVVGGRRGATASSGAPLGLDLQKLDSFTASFLFSHLWSATIQNPNNSENKVVRLAESREALAVARSWWSQSNAHGPPPGVAFLAGPRRLDL